MFSLNEAHAEMKRQFEAGDPEAAANFAGAAAFRIFALARKGLVFSEDGYETPQGKKIPLGEDEAEALRTFPNLVLRSLEDCTAYILEGTGYPLPVVKIELGTLAALADYSRQLCSILKEGRDDY